MRMNYSKRILLLLVQFLFVWKGSYAFFIVLEQPTTTNHVLLYHDRSSMTLLLASSGRGGDAVYNDDDDDDDRTTNTITKSTAVETALTLQKQVEQLRAEAAAMEYELQLSKEAKIRKEQENVDRWIQELLVVTSSAASNNNSNNNNSNSNNNNDNNGGGVTIEVLHTKEHVAKLLQDKRYSAEQVTKMFNRICETSSPYQSIDHCSPLISLLLDAACIVDCLERDENPNKRWNHRVERDLRRKLFAMGWGISIDLAIEDLQRHQRERSSSTGGITRRRP